MTACTAYDADTATDDDTGTPELALGAPNPNLCTAVKVTAPGNGFFGSVGNPTALTALATCPIGQTPEYQFLVKPAGASNWQFLGGFVPGSSSWSPPSPGPWAVSVVARGVGAPEPYQTRSNAVLGTVTAIADQVPVATDDVLTTNVNTPGSADLLGNDSDPDGDTLSIASVTQGAHGTVKFTGGTATYTPAASYTGGDSFTYTLSDGHGGTATGSVLVTVDSGPACTVSVAQAPPSLIAPPLRPPTSGTFGENLHLNAIAACNAGPAEVQWYHKVNSAYVVVQAYSTTLTLDFTPTFIGPNLFYAAVRRVGTLPTQASSNVLSVNVVDNVPACTAVRMVTPTNNQDIPVTVPQTLMAVATCPVDTVPEYQFWVKLASTSNWQILPDYTTEVGSWTPPSVGVWNVRSVARSVGSHGSYQVASMAVVVNVTGLVCTAPDPTDSLTSGSGFTAGFCTQETPSTQCDLWTTFVGGLTSSSYSSITISGSADPIGVTCDDTDAATQLCQALHNAGEVSVDCNGRSWAVGGCGGGSEISANGNICSCDLGYIVRPCIGNDNWGGANGDTCGAASQTLSVTCL